MTTSAHRYQISASINSTVVATITVQKLCKWPSCKPKPPKNLVFCPRQHSYELSQDGPAFAKGRASPAEEAQILGAEAQESARVVVVEAEEQAKPETRGSSGIA